MSLRTLPLLVLNLGGEMLYIVDQRLRAQSIPGDKARQDAWTDVDRRRVMNDIIGGIFNKKFVDELFKPQELYSRKALRSVFERLVHASIMRLNAPSMDKLYDLMTMAFKCQVLLCPRPKDLLLVTFNHLDAIKDFIYESPKTLNQVDVTFRRLLDTYGSLSAGELQLIRQTLLIFFQDIHIRVSILLKDKVQNSNGHFVLPISGPVPWGTEIPGLIRYSISRPVETDTSGAAKSLACHVKENSTPNPLAKEELNLLARLMGGLEIKKPLGSEAGFRLNLFTTDEEEEHAALTHPEELPYQVISIHADQDEQRNEELARIMGEFEVPEQPTQTISKGADLLAMMDEL
ncbi:protein OSCP1 isoform X3 [Varanus komodoensis]|uniref:protein OSCP1 isoform X3 n=1 Tax=Varanus komodoensis TaxID=61221 RepID=UPI001CF78DA7|nr:protein OSCP1 isoform X3 [Varanus komodoensis]